MKFIYSIADIDHKFIDYLLPACVWHLTHLCCSNNTIVEIGEAFVNMPELKVQ